MRQIHRSQSSLTFSFFLLCVRCRTSSEGVSGTESGRLVLSTKHNLKAHLIITVFRSAETHSGVGRGGTRVRRSWRNWQGHEQSCFMWVLVYVSNLLTWDLGCLPKAPCWKLVPQTEAPLGGGGTYRVQSHWWTSHQQKVPLKGILEHPPLCLLCLSSVCFLTTRRWAVFFQPAPKPYCHMPPGPWKHEPSSTFLPYKFPYPKSTLTVMGDWAVWSC